MVTILHCYPRCGNCRLIRYGIVAGKQRWRCMRCRYQFTRPDRHGPPEPTRRSTVSLCGHGLSFNTVAHLLGTTAQSVLLWVCS
jgi:transposase-like protein